MLISMLLLLFSHRTDTRCFLSGLGPGKKMCRPELLQIKIKTDRNILQLYLGISLPVFFAKAPYR